MSVTDARDRRTDPDAAPLLEVVDLRKSYGSEGWFGGRSRHRVLDGVSFRLRRGEVLALVGESGSGKSTIAKLLLRLEPVDDGRILLDGVDILARERSGASRDFRRRVQMVFQDPFASLHPMQTVLTQLATPLERLAGAPVSRHRALARELLSDVGLEPADELLDRMPHSLSGGQRQRVAIARALAARPDLLIADEPTSMLDVSLRVGVLELLDRLRRERGLAILLITHDLASARVLSDRMMVLYRGKLVEEGPAESLIGGPIHPYTQALIAAADTERAPSKLERLADAAPRDARGGCDYAARCSQRIDGCESHPPPVVQLEGARTVRCILPSRPPAHHGAH
jgi:peptide/nickel transport system ATP-binding protein